MNDIVNEFCEYGVENDRNTDIPGVWILYQDSPYQEPTKSRHEYFWNPFAEAVGCDVEMNFVLFGFDGYDENGDPVDDRWPYYRSLTDEEIAQCVQRLESVTLPERKVFLGGSQSWTVLPVEVKSTLDCWMRRHIAFLIGDRKGADQLMQKYLHEKGYEKVTVFVNGGDNDRCNEGRWGVVHVLSPAWPYSDEYCSARDIRMAEAADEAYLLWDGNSIRTRENIIRMRRLGKDVTVCREQAGWCWEEECTDTHSSLSDECLQNELRRYSWEENTVINAAILRLAREAEKELHLKKDEAFTLERLLPSGKPDPDAPQYPPFLSFSDVLAAIGDEMLTMDPTLPKPSYSLEKWAAKGEFNLTFFRYRDELYDMDPPQDDYHMEQTARFELEGDEVVSFRLIKREKEKR